MCYYPAPPNDANIYPFKEHKCVLTMCFISLIGSDDVDDRSTKHLLFCWRKMVERVWNYKFKLSYPDRFVEWSDGNPQPNIGEVGVQCSYLYGYIDPQFRDETKPNRTRHRHRWLQFKWQRDLLLFYAAIGGVSRPHRGVHQHNTSTEYNSTWHMVSWPVETIVRLHKSRTSGLFSILDTTQ